MKGIWKKWRIVALNVAAILTVAAGSGLLGTRAQDAVGPALDVLLAPIEETLFV